MTDEIKQETADTKNLLDKSQEVINQLKAENDRREEILRKEEVLKNMQILGGTSGAPATIEKKEETAKEYADRIMKNEVKKE